MAGPVRPQSAACSTASLGVASATRQSVLAALDVLGYERPVRLRQRSAGLVGLITPELENPIFPRWRRSSARR